MNPAPLIFERLDQQVNIQELRLEDHYLWPDRAPYWKNPSLLLQTDGDESAMQKMRELLVHMLQSSAQLYDAIFVFTGDAAQLELGMDQWRSLGPYARILPPVDATSLECLVTIQKYRRVQGRITNILIILDCDLNAVDANTRRVIEKFASNCRKYSVTLATMAYLPGTPGRRRVPRSVRENCDVMVADLSPDNSVALKHLHDKFFSVLPTLGDFHALVSQTMERNYLAWRNASGFDDLHHSAFCLPRDTSSTSPFPCLQQSRVCVDPGIFELGLPRVRSVSLLWTRALAVHTFTHDSAKEEALQSRMLRDAQVVQWVVQSPEYRERYDAFYAALWNNSFSLPVELVDLTLGYALPLALPRAS